MLRTSFCDYSDAYILVSRTITITGAGNDNSVKRLDERNKGVIFQDCKVNNTQIDNAKYIDAVMPTYNLNEYNDNYSKTSGILWQYYRDDLIKKIPESVSFKYKINITGKATPAGNTKNVEIAVPLKYLSNF